MTTYSIVSTLSGIEAFADEWQQLHARTGKSPVTDYDRFHVWWRTIGNQRQGASLHVVIGREGGKLMAVLPLVVVRRMGNLLRILCEPDGMMFETEVLCEDPALVLPTWYAAMDSPHYDLAKIKGVYPQSSSHAALCKIGRVNDTMDAFFLRCDWPTSKDWLASLSGNARGNFNRCSRRLEEKGSLRYEVYKDGPLPMAIVDGMVRHKIDWCSDRGKRGSFERDDVEAYFREWVETCASQGKLFLAWLQCGDDVIGYNLGLINDDVCYAYFWTYDPAWSRYSPGNVIMMNTIAWAIDNNLKGIDFIYTGQSESEKNFKRKYANQTGHCYEFTFRKSLYGSVADWGFNLLNRARSFRKMRISAPDKSRSNRQGNSAPHAATGP
jgi:CelD/BcsL family acetyltransferase involved in cellulose biosynthesis